MSCIIKIIRMLELQTAGHDIHVCVQDCVTRLMSGCIYHNKYVGSGPMSALGSNNMGEAALSQNLEYMELCSPQAAVFLHCILFPFLWGCYAQVLNNNLTPERFEKDSGNFLGGWEQKVDEAQRRRVFNELACALDVLGMQMSRQQSQQSQQQFSFNPRDYWSTTMASDRGVRMDFEAASSASASSSSSSSSSVSSFPPCTAPPEAHETEEATEKKQIGEGKQQVANDSYQGSRLPSRNRGG